jgi:hypothetical protein
MKGNLDLINENEWVVRYRTKESSGVVIYKSIPLSSFNKIMYKSKLEVGIEVEFRIVKENDHISHCKCTREQYDTCEFFVRSGINECINFENIEVEVAKIESIASKKNQTFDRTLVKELLIEVKNRFAVINNDNYNSDLDVIEWFERNFPIKH